MFEETEEMKVLDRKVVKSNELIQRSRYSLSLQQQKIILYVISMITPYDDDLKEYTFSIQEFCNVCGIYDSGRNYSNLKSAILGIVNQTKWAQFTDGKFRTVRWIEEATIDPSGGTVSIKLDKKLKPHLIQLKEHFTSYELIWTLHFKSKYTVRLYEVIKSIHFQELTEYSREYQLDELRILLDAEKYTAWIHFKQRVLEPAVREINETSDKNVFMEVIKKGRAVEKVRFTITTKDTLETLELKDKIMKDMGYEQMTLWDELEGRGLV